MKFIDMINNINYVIALYYKKKNIYNHLLNYLCYICIYIYPVIYKYINHAYTSNLQY